jgi:NAD-dependent dihydropyrimidine dehydrogenase PreA subunit
VGTGPALVDLIGEHLQLALNLLNLRKLEIIFDPVKCQGVWECYQVCPVACWVPDYDRGVAIFQNAESCIACNACVLQCPQGAIELKVAGGS